MNENEHLNLPNNDWLVKFISAWMEDKSVDKVAAKMGKSPEEVRSLLKRLKELGFNV